MGDPMPVSDAGEDMRIAMRLVNHIDEANRPLIAEAVMDRLTPEARREIMSKYCRGCGDKRANCPCERDE